MSGWISPRRPLAFNAMTSLMLLDDACAELVSGGQTTVNVDVKLKQILNGNQTYTSNVTSTGSGANSSAANQTNFMLNNIGYAKFA